MTKEFVKSIPYEELERAYNAYTQLQIAYENSCGGPYKAREYKEYFAICDSRDNIRQEVTRRAQGGQDGQ